MKKQQRSAITNKIVFVVLLLLSFFISIQLSLKADAETRSDNSEAVIMDSHVKAKIEFTKDHSSNYTTVGDKVTVTTTFEKIDDGALPDVYRQTSALILFPDETQGLTLNGEPTMMYQTGAIKEEGLFLDTSKEVHRNVIFAFNLERHVYFEDTLSYDGRFTEFPINKNEVDDGPYDDKYTLQKLLINKGDTITLTYEATVTEKALKNDHFIFRAVLYDSKKQDFDWDSFIDTSMPSIQSLGLAFDSDIKTKTIEIQNGQPEQLDLTGTWSGEREDITSVLTVDGVDIPVSEDCFHEDGTFSIPLSLKKLNQQGEGNLVHLKITDSNGQLAEDDAVITLINKSVPPELQLSDKLTNQIVYVVPTDQTMAINGQWRDEDSDTVSLFYKINGQEKILQENIVNGKKNEWLDFSQTISLDSLTKGINQIDVYVRDEEGLESAVETIILQLDEGSVKFKSLDPQIQFENATVSGKTTQSKVNTPFELMIEDTTGAAKDWNLVVTQLAPFSNGVNNLSAELLYQNKEQQLSITSADSVVLPVNQASSTTYSLIQDTVHQFLLNVYPGNYVGDYQTDLEWSIVRAP